MLIMPTFQRRGIKYIKNTQTNTIFKLDIDNSPYYSVFTARLECYLSMFFIIRGVFAVNKKIYDNYKFICRNSVINIE